MNWFDVDQLVGWYEDGCWTIGRVVGGLFGEKVIKRGEVGFVNMRIVGGKGWWVKFEIGFERVVGLRRGRFWLRVGRSWKKVG